MQVEALRRLRFDDGSPVRAASGVACFADGWLVAQDDATHAAWVRDGGVEPVRVLPAVEGHDVFSSAEGTKHLKPDLEAACEVQVDGRRGVLLLGSGSTAARMRAVLVTGDDRPQAQVADLSPLYRRVADLLGLDLADLNLEGAAHAGAVLRWFARGNLAAGVPSASVDVDLASLLVAVTGGDVAQVALEHPRRYDLGVVDGVGLTVTDAVALPDGRVLVSAAAEDTPNAVDDGPVVASALALLDGAQVLGMRALPLVDGEVAKVEGLALLEVDAGGARLIAVVDDDQPDAASAELVLGVRWA